MMKRLLILAAASVFALTACAPYTDNGNSPAISDNSEVSSAPQQGERVELLYAEGFSIEKYPDNIALVTIGGNERYVVADKGTDAAKLVSGDFGDADVIYRPVDNIYAAASSSMDFFHALDALDSVTMTSTKESDWGLDFIRERIQSGKIEFVGKYNAPDYEFIASENCGLAVESQMITHSPEVKEKLEALGIPVIAERSSYEAHPLGRLEWIKLYGELLGKQTQAQAFFDEKNALLNGILTDERTDKSVAFFYISTNGSVNVRKPGDYISKMIELAGGSYIFTADDLSVDENALSTMNIQMETFYAKAKDADILIYNSTIDGELETLDELIAKDGLLADFKAVREGNVWCSGKNMYQQTTGAADMISDLHKIFTGKAEDKLTYLYRLK